MNAEAIARALGGKRVGNQWLARCPCHNDANPSLALRDGEDGRVLVRCHAGCKQVAVIATLRERGLLPTPAPRTTLRAAKREVGRRSWNFNRAGGIARHHRIDFSDGSKTMFWEPKGVRPGDLIYAPEGLDGFDVALVVEGEKAADAAAGWAIAAVYASVCGAASVPNDAILKPIASQYQRIFLWPDNDNPGRAHMQKIGARLLALGAQDVRVVEWADAPSGGDAADFKGSVEDAQALLDAAKPFEPPADAKAEIRVGQYVERPEGLYRVKMEPGSGEILIPLTNFTARIVADIERDDGAERTRHFEVEVQRGERTATVSVPVGQFATMRWPVEALGSDAVVHAGAGAADHARCAIQLLSRDVKRRTVFAHTGWRKINSQWMFLHNGGAIGADGPVDGVAVELPPELEPFKLELPEDPVAALRASLRLLDLGPGRITVPLLGAVVRAVLGGADFTLFLYGRTGVFKTELAALAQQHFGAGFDARHLPANFTSTANSNEGLAFLAKDALLAVDEFAPPASGSERDTMHRDASRLLRSQGNAAGRARMRSDGTLRPAKPSRALLLATGEELPRGQSARARMFVIEVPAGAIDPGKLTACQHDATHDLYAQATACFIRWLAPRLDEVRAEFESFRANVRQRFSHGHARTADTRAQLTSALGIFSKFLADVGVLADNDLAAFQSRILAALEEAASAQAEYVESIEPTGAFMRLLSAALGSGAAHLADPHGGPPAGRETACGWRLAHFGEREEWVPQGARVGWLDGDDLLLERDAAYRAAQGMAADRTGIEVLPGTLTRRLHERGLLVSVEPSRRTLTIRRTLAGRRIEVLHLRAEILGLPPSGKVDQADQTASDGVPGQHPGQHSGRLNAGF